MSRTKKSRKPASAPTAKPKLSKAELANVEQRVRKKKGKKPGNRQQEAQPISDKNQNTKVNKDPRIGSKKPIALGGTVKLPQAKPVTSKASNSDNTKASPIAAIRRVDKSNDNVALTLAQQLAAIEDDEQLQAILVKQEEALALTEQEVDYYNNKMERHQVLSAELGLDDDDDTSDSDEFIGSDSEDELWDKLDRSDLSDFEEKE